MGDTFSFSDALRKRADTSTSSTWLASSKFEVIVNHTVTEWQLELKPFKVNNGNSLLITFIIGNKISRRYQSICCCFVHHTE